MCAQDLNTCIYVPALISVISLTNTAAQNHDIDSTSNLKNDLFSSTIDTIVKSPFFCLFITA